MSIYTEHFETVFGTRQNIQTLRNKVLELAIQGKLVEQDPNDKSTSELLQDIQTEKKRLIKEKKIKKTKLLPEIKAGEVPFKIPESWEWVKFGGFAVISGGKRIPKGYTYSEQETEHVYIRVTDMKNGSIDLLNLKYINDEVFQQIKNYTIDADDLYITVAGTIGKVGTVPTEVAGMNLTENADKITSIMVNQLFVKYALESQYVQKQISDSVNKMAQPKLSIQSIQQLVLPLPPVGEQKRIVTKIESLIAEIDHLEKYLERKERLEATLPQAVVSAINKCQNEEELKAQLALVIAHFTDVFKTPESLQELRNVILKLGIQGKLVSQNPADEPAGELLRHIQVEKTLLIKEKKIKKEKDLPEIEDDEIPFEIPTSWEWVRLGSVIELISGRDLGPNEYNDKEDGLPYYTGASNFQKGKLIENRWTKLPKVISLEGDLLITVKGTIGDMAFQKVDEAHIARQIMSLRNTYSINMRYLFHFMESYVHQLKAEARSMIPGISRDNLLLAVIPVPPVTEQHRIVDKIESLFAVIDKMEKEMQRKQRIVKAMATI